MRIGLYLCSLAALLGLSTVLGFVTHQSNRHTYLGNPRSATVDDDDNDLSLAAFQTAKAQRETSNNGIEDFDGYSMRDVILEKWGACFDVDFQRVNSFGSQSLYLNVLPFFLGRRPFRHESEYDYLCHLQAVVEILQQYDQLNYVLHQIDETTKKPIAGRNPIVAVPLRLDLTREQVEKILGS